MELEKIRVADAHVRWEDEDDVDECRSCKAVFTVTRRKVFIRNILFIVGNTKILIQLTKTVYFNYLDQLPSLWINLL